MPRTLFVSFLLSFPLFGQDITLAILPVERPATASVLVVNTVVTNHLDVDVPNVEVVLRLDNDPRTILAGQSDAVWSCRDDGTLQSVRCTAAVLPAKQATPLTFYIDALHGRFRLTGAVRWIHDAREGAAFASGVAYFPWDIHVTHDGDAGDGSLRDAIRLANEDCEGRRLPCRIVFDAPMTIQPSTPLPVLFGYDLIIDGRGEVTLDGSQVSGGSGLEIDGELARGELRGLAIRAFPWDGVHVKRGSFTIADNVIEANANRGVYAEVPVNVFRNLIRYHGRSGVFVAYAAHVENNDIEDNGASGIFAGNDWSIITRNRIRNNAHFGVAVPRHVGKIHVNQNSMNGNRISGIDRGLDGIDGDRYDDYATNAAYIPSPRLSSATYDAATNTTTIRGTYFDAQDHWGTWKIEIFSNPVNEAQGETFLGETTAKNGELAFVADGDLRGRFITATGHRRLFLGWSGDYWWPSEYSDTVEVH